LIILNSEIHIFLLYQLPVANVVAALAPASTPKSMVMAMEQHLCLDVHAREAVLVASNLP